MNRQGGSGSFKSAGHPSMMNWILHNKKKLKESVEYISVDPSKCCEAITLFRSKYLLMKDQEAGCGSILVAPVEPCVTIAIRKTLMMTKLNSTGVQAPDSIGRRKGKYDSGGLKPSGGLLDDTIDDSVRDRPNLSTILNRKSTKKPLLSCKKYEHVGTLNVRTIRLQHKRVELGHLFEKAGIGVLEIQEHRIVHEEIIHICKLSKDFQTILL